MPSFLSALSPFLTEAAKGQTAVLQGQDAARQRSQAEMLAALDRQERAEDRRRRIASDEVSRQKMLAEIANLESQANNRNTPPPEEPETFTGQPFEGLDASGAPGFYLRGSRGTVKPVEGVRPMPKASPTPAAGSFVPMTDGTGKVTFFNPTTGQSVAAPENLQPNSTSGTNELVKRQRAIDGVRQALQRFETNIATNGAVLMPGTVRAGQETDYESLQLQMKELYNLGVLNGPDLALMRRIINEPGSLLTAAKAAAGGEKASALILAQVQKMKEQIDDFERGLSAPAAGRRPQTLNDYSSLIQPPPGWGKR